MIAVALLSALWVAWATSAAMVAYLLLLTAAAGMPRRTIPQALARRRFRVIIPAHNEALVLGPVLRRLDQMEYPHDHFDVIVVADNCTDQTAELARNCGVRVLERFSETDRGKGHALAYAFDELRNEQIDAYVILDADTLVEPDVLDVFNRYLDAGHTIVQAHYDVLNPWENRRTSLMYVALTIFNYVRPLGRRALGVSTGLKGNGMCFTKAVIQRYPWNAFSLAEDIEYTTTLVLHGEQVVFAPEAKVAAQMPVARNQATSQRVRWEAGRLQLARRDGLRLVWRGIAQRNFNVFDWGMDLVIPPLAALVLAIVAGTGLSAIAAIVLRTSTFMLLVKAWIGLLMSVVVFVNAAMIVGKLPRQAYAALLSAPGYVLWKVWIYISMIMRRAPHQWVRTARTQIQEQ